MPDPIVTDPGPVLDLSSLDLSRLQSGPTGHQKDPGVGGPGAFRVVRAEIVLIVEEKAHPGKEYAVDPVDLALGRFEAHERFLLCASDGQRFHITDEASAKEELIGQARSKMTQFAARALGVLSPLLSQAGPNVLVGVLAQLLGIED